MESADALGVRPPFQRTAVVILGMHRSGTSALTKMVSLLGCDLPKTIMDASPTNETGHWESNRIMELNDRLLESAGTSWNDWVEFNTNWSESPKADSFRREAQAVLESEFGDSPLFVIKDPRICRMPTFWLSALEEFGARPLVILPLRNPLEVAASLQVRNGFEPALGHLLWLRHVLDAEHSTRGMPRYFTSYDRLLASWPSVAKDAEAALGLHWPRLADTAAAEIDTYLAKRLQHHKESPERVTENPLLSNWLRDAYRILSNWASNGERAEDFGTLDCIRAELNSAASAFSRLVLAGQKALASNSELQSNLEDAQRALAGANDEQSRLRAELEATAHAATEAEQRLIELRDRLAQTESALEQRRHEANETAAELAAARAELQAMKSVQSESEKLISDLREHANQLMEDLSERRSAYSALEQTMRVQSERQAGQEAALAAAIEEAERAQSATKSLSEEMGARLEAQKREITSLANLSAERSAEKASAERKLSDRVDELARLTSLYGEAEQLVRQREEEARHSSHVAAREIGRTVTTLLSGKRWPSIFRRLQLRREASRLLSSGLFDAKWYLAYYDDVAESGMNPVYHYLRHGADEGRFPSPTCVTQEAIPTGKGDLES